MRFFKIIFKISYLREHLICGLAQSATFNSMPEPASGDVASPKHTRVAAICSVTALRSVLSSYPPPAREEKISFFFLQLSNKLASFVVLLD